MTPQVATRLKLHEDAVALNPRAPHASASDARGASQFYGAVIPLAAEGYASAPVLWRESLHRRLLGVADVICACLALALMLRLFDERRVAAVAIGGAVLIVLLFKMAGLYDRDDLRLVHSTLDEVPLLTQVTGVFALGMAALQTLLLAGDLVLTRLSRSGSRRSVRLSFGRVLARAVAGRTAAAGAMPSHRRRAAGGSDSREARFEPSACRCSGLASARWRGRRRCRPCCRPWVIREHRRRA